jgi:hypothetical protein
LVAYGAAGVLARWHVRRNERTTNDDHQQNRYRDEELGNVFKARGFAIASAAVLLDGERSRGYGCVRRSISERR